MSKIIRALSKLEEEIRDYGSMAVVDEVRLKGIFESPHKINTRPTSANRNTRHKLVRQTGPTQNELILLEKTLIETDEEKRTLSSIMNTILDRVRKTVRGRTKTQQSFSIGDFDIEQLEDLIFIGREKG